MAAPVPGPLPVPDPRRDDAARGIVTHSLTAHAADCLHVAALLGLEALERAGLKTVLPITLHNLRASAKDVTGWELTRTIDELRARMEASGIEHERKQRRELAKIYRRRTKEGA